MVRLHTFNSELQQFNPNPLRTPQVIFFSHLSDECVMVSGEILGCFYLLFGFRLHFKSATALDANASAYQVDQCEALVAEKRGDRLWCNRFTVDTICDCLRYACYCT